MSLPHRRWFRSVLWTGYAFLCVGLLGYLVWGMDQTRAAQPAEFGFVSGRVFVAGEPLDTVEVVFLPEPGFATRTASACCYTDEFGRYQLRTERHDVNGAAVGRHRVLVRDITALPSPGGGKAKPARIPDVYSHPFQTPLRLDVKPGYQTFDFDLPAAAGPANPTALAAVAGPAAAEHLRRLLR